MTRAKWPHGGFVALFVLACPALCPGQDIFSRRIVAGLTSPVFATSAPGDPSRLWVVQQTGQIVIVNTSTSSVEGTFLNLANVSGANLITGNEQGLLGLAFAPDYVTSGKFYINYTTNNGNSTDTNGFTRVQEFKRSAGNQYQADVSTARQILQFQQPFPNHKAGWMGYSPNDGNLYIATGDGGNGWDPNNNGQSRTTFLGKMLRIDPSQNNPTNPNIHYVIPNGNPYKGNTSGFLEEIWAYGLRNPWRNSFDRVTGDLWIGDVGQAQREEVNFQGAGNGGGQNYGWRLREGFIATDNGVGGPKPPGNVDPIYDYQHNTGNFGGFAEIGGYRYRGPDLLDEVNGHISLYGTYFFADNVTEHIWTLRYVGASNVDVDLRDSTLRNAVNGGQINQISSFGEDGLGQLYVLDLGGEVFRIEGSPVPEPGSLLLLGAAGLGTAYYVNQRRKVRHNN